MKNRTIVMYSKKLAVKVIVLLIITLIFFPSSGSALIERRKEQFLTEPSYMILPLPYSIPGIGSGMMVMGLAGNFLDTHLDIYGMGISGDAGGYIIGLDDIHLIPETLIVMLYYQNLNKAAVQSYDKRGMDTEKDEYTQLELNKVLGMEGEVLLTLFDRRVELFAGSYQQEASITTIRDSKGVLINEFSEPYISASESTVMGVRLDFTDDYQDPKQGLRMEATLRPHPSDKAGVDPNYSVINKSLSIYIPIADDHTWAFNFFTSDALVSKEGETDRAAIEAELDLSCNPTEQNYETCQETQQELVDMFVAMRKYGNSQGLGGQYRLRAYPQGRFEGAHTFYFATEYRWNFITEVTPFDFWIWKDVSTGIQLALFHEMGAVEDIKDDLSSSMRTSSGLGIRMVSGSGYVYRFDVATGDEGVATTVFFNYPW
jgi:hypothetical protein